MARGVRRTIRNDTIKAALKNFLVPEISEKFLIISMRCLWDVHDNDLSIATFNISNKREEIEKIVNAFDDVVLYFSCTCAMESSTMRKKLLKKKRQVCEDKENPTSDEDNDYDTYQTGKDSTIIPGNSFYTAKLLINRMYLILMHYFLF